MPPESIDTGSGGAPSPEPGEALTRLAREEASRVLALLARRFGDLDLADESVQDALTEAARTWPERGVPANPAGWLLAVARRKAIDRLRRTSSARRRTLAAAPELATGADPTPPRPEDALMLDDPHDLPGGDRQVEPVDDDLCLRAEARLDREVADLEHAQNFFFFGSNVKSWLIAMFTATSLAQR